MIQFHQMSSVSKWSKLGTCAFRLWIQLPLTIFVGGLFYWSMIDIPSKHPIHLMSDDSVFKLFWRLFISGFDLLMLWEINKAMLRYTKVNPVNFKMVRNCLIASSVMFGLLMLQVEPSKAEFPIWFTAIRLGIACLFFCPGLWLGLVCAYSRSSFASKQSKA